MRDEMREWFYLGLNMKQLEAGSVKDKIRKRLGVKYLKKREGSKSQQSEHQQDSFKIVRPAKMLQFENSLRNLFPR